MTPTALRLAVVGARGRMGRQLLGLIERADDLCLVGQVVRATSPTDIEAQLAAARVVIDVTAPSAAATMAPLCARHQLAYVVASTSLTQDDELALTQAAATTAVLQASNFSLGMQVMQTLVEAAARRLATLWPELAVHVGELHHGGKQDSPSGTAQQLVAGVEAASAGRLRATTSSVRGGTAAGEHTVLFLGPHERLTVSHHCESAELFARGALRAARWLAAMGPGRYSLADVVGS